MSEEKYASWRKPGLESGWTFDTVSSFFILVEMTTVSSGLWMEVDPDVGAAASDGGYSLLDAAAICAAFTLVVATIVIGNVLVIIAGTPFNR